MKIISLEGHLIGSLVGEVLVCLGEVEVNVFKHAFIALPSLMNFAFELLKEPAMQLDNLSSVEVGNGFIEDARVREFPSELSKNVLHLEDVALSLNMSLLSYPRGSFHEFSPLLVAGVDNSLDSSKSLLEELVFLNQSSSLSFYLILYKLFIALESLEIFLAAIRLACLGRVRGRTAKAGIKGLSQLDDFDRVLIADSGYLAHVLIL